MPAFKFRLAPVQRLRARVKDEKQWDLRALYDLRHIMTEEIAALEQQMRATEETLTGRVDQLFSAIDLKLHAEHALVIDRRIKEKLAAVARLDQRIVEKRAELVEAMREEKTLERLREHQERKFRHEQDAIEQKFGDEVGQRKFVNAGRRKKIPG